MPQQLLKCKRCRKRDFCEKKKVYFLSLLFAIAILSIDFFSKQWVVHSLPEYYWSPHAGIGVFKNFLGIEFSLVHATNTGTAWSLFSSFPYLLLGVRIVLIIGMLGYLFFWSPPLAFVVPLTSIIAGALGNVVDFFLYGHVIDLFYFVFWGYSYPVFNVADIAITTGVISLCLIAWIKK